MVALRDIDGRGSKYNIIGRSIDETTTAAAPMQHRWPLHLSDNLRDRVVELNKNDVSGQ